MGKNKNNNNKIKVSLFYLFMIIYFLGHATQHVGSLFPDWRSTPMLPVWGQSLNQWISREVPSLFVSNSG